MIDVQEQEIKVKVLKDARETPATLNKIFLGGSGYSYSFNPNDGSASETSIKLTAENNREDTYYHQTFKGVFMAPKSGQYRFRLSSDDWSRVKMKAVDFSSAYNESDLELICENIGAVQFRDYF